MEMPSQNRQSPARPGAGALGIRRVVVFLSCFPGVGAARACTGAVLVHPDPHPLVRMRLQHRASGRARRLLRVAGFGNNTGLPALRQLPRGFLSDVRTFPMPGHRICFDSSPNSKPQGAVARAHSCASEPELWYQNRPEMPRTPHVAAIPAIFVAGMPVPEAFGACVVVSH